ncbi:hypothetical protein LXL04_038906 [Taraxacum kok-saghyz]
MVRESEWREVRRRRNLGPKPFHGSSDDPSVTSYFVKGIPGDATKAEIWKLCAPLGQLVDVYIAGRKDATGAFFAFVRFKGVSKPDELENGLNNLEYMGRKMTVNLSRHPRASGTADPGRAPISKPHRPIPVARTDGRSYAAVANGNRSDLHAATAKEIPLGTISLPCIKETQNWLGSHSLVGEAKLFDILCNLPSLISLEGFNVAEIKYLGGLQVLLQFKSEKAASVFKANRNIWLKWFSWVDVFGKRSVRFEGIAWIKIVGIPVIAWDESNFASIAGRFGKVLVNINPFWTFSDVSQGKVCILTASKKKINEEITVSIDGSLHRIGIFEVEDDWGPFKPFIVGSTEDSEEENENDDGISDTFGGDEMELEEGEIDPAGSKQSDDTTSPESEEKIADSFEPLHDEEKESPGGCKVKACEGHNNKATSIIPSPNNDEEGFLNNEERSKVGPNHPISYSKDIHVGSQIHVGSIGNGPNVSPSDANVSSSPEFGPGTSAIKRRRLKQKKKSTMASRNSVSNILGKSDEMNTEEILSPVRASPSLDLNRSLQPPAQPSPRIEVVGPYSPTMSCSASSEINRIVDIGNQVGFSVDSSNLALLEAVNGGGAKLQ